MIEITTENFEDEVLNSELPVIIDFWAPWCGPCKSISPIFEKLSLLYDEVKFCKCNLDENGDFANMFSIRNIPTFITFIGGELIDVKVGLLSEEDMEEMLNDLI